MAPVCRLIRADRGYVTRGDGEETATAYRACLGVGDGDVGMEGEAERVGVAGQTIRHFWGSELFYALVDPGQEPRHVGTIEPLWNLFDFTREGRPAHWHEQFSY